jgi:hypothetical protein
MEVLFMDLTILSKKISSYRTPSGRITNLPDELLGEILHAWEQWAGAPAAFYKTLGADHRKMGSLMGRAKKLKREGAFDGLSFTEVVVEDNAPLDQQQPVSGCGIELVWDNNKIIRFGTPELLMDFLKKAA